MSYLVTGSKGQVGCSLKEKISEEVIGLDRSGSDVEVDISKSTAVSKIEEAKPDIIIHAAAITDLDKAEENPEMAYEVNSKGTKNVVEAAERISARLIYISTDYVFDGKRGEYSERDTPNPQSVYAKTKYEGEKIVRNSDVDSTIFRTSVVFREGFDNFFTWAKSELEKGKEVGAVTDQVCCPTYAPNLAEFIIEAAQKEIIGTYHAVGNTKLNRYESVQIMKQELNLDGDLKRSKVKDLPWDANRPKDSSLSLAKLKENFETQPISISEAFKRMKE